MNPFELPPRTAVLRDKLLAFMDEHVYPNEEQVAAEAAAQSFESPEGWTHCATIERLKGLAREQGLWNLFLPASERAPEGLTNYEYAPLAEIMGRTQWASEVFNCSAPDTGNMETIERYGTEAHKEQWLEPLLRGEIRSAFLMTEPGVASSDATNIETDIRRDGDEYVINGRKWWSSGAGTKHCKVYVVMGKTDPTADRHHQQSMILVP
ncbi:MAG: acyl-CoA dehydrogenase family protein, partial [Dermatophilaceae bacterium]